MHRTHGTGVVVWEVVALQYQNLLPLLFLLWNNNVLWFDIPVYNMIIMGNLRVLQIPELQYWFASLMVRRPFLSI